MHALHIQTPVLMSQILKNQNQQDIYFKMECLQPSGSFKLRGIGALCQAEAANGRKAFVASSGGNAGIAVAYCGMRLGIPTKVFIPRTSHQIYIDAIHSYGAEVVVAGDVWDDANVAALDYQKTHAAAYIPPFDHPTLWSGHATMMYEIVQQEIPKPDAVVLSVGGGGLACGVLTGMHAIGWQDVPLIAVETLGADSFAQSVAAGKLITLPAITSKATSLGAKRVASALMDWTNKHTIYPIVVTDQEALDGCYAFAQDQRHLVELASGASLAVAYQHHAVIQQARTLLVIVCGGINISPFHL